MFELGGPFPSIEDLRFLKGHNINDSTVIVKKSRHITKTCFDDGFEIIFLACLGKNWLYYL